MAEAVKAPEIRRRKAGDGLPNDGDASVLRDQWLRIKGHTPNEFLDFTFYKFGAAIDFRCSRSSGNDPVLEFHASVIGGGGYSAVFALSHDGTAGLYHRAQVRNIPDTDALDLAWDSTGPIISTETNANLDMGVALARYERLTSTEHRLDSARIFGWTSGACSAALDTAWSRISAGVAALKNGANPCALRVYGDAAKHSVYGHDGTDGYFNASSGALNFQLGGTNKVAVISSALIGGTDNTMSLGLSAGNRFSSLFLAGPSVTVGGGTGLTVNTSGEVRKQTYKCTVDRTGFSAAALTADKTLFTLPAKARIVAVYAETTTKYIGGAVATCTLRIGSTAGGVEVLASHDVFTAAVTKGLADADLGTSMVRAAAIQGGFMPSFTATTNIIARITTTGANTNALTQGSTTFYFEVEVLP